MPKVSKGAGGEYEAMVAAYRDAINDFNSTLLAFNEAMQAKWDEEIAPKVTALNQSIASVKTSAEEVSTELQDQFDNRSDNWQSGDKGQAFQEWIDQFLEVQYIDEVELECHQYDEVEEETLDAEVEMEYGF
jgi:hypothetical protein